MVSHKIPKKIIFIEYFFETPNYITVFLFPFFLMMTSPVLLEISKSFKTDVRNLNLVFTFFNIGIISGQLTSVFYNRSFKKISIINVFYFLLIIVVVILFFSYSLIVFFILYLIYGYAIGVIFIQANEYLLYSTIENKDKLIALGLTFWPIGALLGPILSSYIVQKNQPWNFMYFAVIFFICVNLILYNTITRKRKYEIEDLPQSNISLRKVFQDKNCNIIFIFTIFSLIFYSMSETVVSSWIPTFFRLEEIFDVQTAGFAISLFWAAIVVGRIITSILVGRVSSSYLLIFLAIVGLISLFFTIYSTNKNIALVAISIAGIGYSGIFPLLISRGSNIYSTSKGLLLTILLASGALGISIAPFFTRLLAKYSLTLSVMLSVYFIIASIIFVLLSIFWEKMLKKN